jgi:hypothetical protein
MKVCWRVLSTFRTVGEKIAEKFEGAFRMKAIVRDTNVNTLSAGIPFQKHSTLRLKPYLKGMKRPTKRDLVFIDESPDYCDRNHGYYTYHPDFQFSVFISL